MKQYDYLIVGAGLFGCTFAYRAAKAGRKCLVIDRRPYPGGNVRCEDAGGITVHKYGPHIFHTGNAAVWDFVNSLVPFNGFINTPLANYRGRMFNLPFNMNTFRQMWGCTAPEEARAIIESQRLKIHEPQNLEEQALSLVGEDIYRTLVKEYTEKQWGLPCTELPAFIIRRLPLRFTYDNNYFNDTYQGIPEGGYNRLVDALLDGIEVRCSCDFFEDRPYWESLAAKVVFTGRLDQYYGYRFGRLGYRSLRFEEERLEISDYQSNAVVNYTSSDVPWTRIVEHKHFDVSNKSALSASHTVITREYPRQWHEGLEPYYPVNDRRNEHIAEQYRAIAASEKNVIFGGRLAEYKYYDMAPLIEKALSESV